MDRTINVGLTGHAEQFRLDPDAYERLSRYLERAAARLQGDPDRAEVLADLERSIGDRLVASVGSGDRLVSAAEIDRILDEIGTVDTGQSHVNDEPATRPRRLQRIREGQQIAGVCNGLAAYSEIDVAWVRTLFVLGTLATGGLLALLYIALAFILPITPRRETRR